VPGGGTSIVQAGRDINLPNTGIKKVSMSYTNGTFSTSLVLDVSNPVGLLLLVSLKYEKVERGGVCVEDVCFLHE